MQQSINSVFIAAAGSGKTTFIVDDAISNPDKKILILTYTIENLIEIKKCFVKKLGFIPKNIKIQSWFSFLLQECARPYQNFIYDKKRIESIAFVEGRSARYVKQSDVERYYFQRGNLIYTDKISQFSCICNERSNGFVISRLEKIFDCIYIDEVQDLGGWDLELLVLLFRSTVQMVLVGDNRQTTFKTNYSAKNNMYLGEKIINFFFMCEKRGICTVRFLKECHRSNQLICNFSDSLFPLMPKTISNNFKTTGHDGIFTIKMNDATTYVEKFKPMVLRHDKRSKFTSENIQNFGLSKGQTFDRVLIIPTKPIKDFLLKGKALEGESRAKFYVAVTRARFSVAFLMNEKPLSEEIQSF
ncbi:DEAD/DEAH box helicase [Paenibacillus pini]|uniref:(+)RNA virus helicase C-terminal domain-containing protein n=1 Tax=Paenibacillus pini JCM 16418 TaxID=1236976 RepID=W7YY55_9BACL|nr:AAA family ATPase [Paenibacillus pini]GAF07359.1 hypothetical protein JCM16418_1372 [Paenibacillus pini JCM 16418]